MTTDQTCQKQFGQKFSSARNQTLFSTHILLSL